MGVTERTKNGEKGVKDMTSEHFLEVTDTAGPHNLVWRLRQGHVAGLALGEMRTIQNTLGGKHTAGERTGPGRRGLLSSAPRGRGNARHQERSPTWNSAAAKL